MRRRVWRLAGLAGLLFLWMSTGTALAAPEAGDAVSGEGKTQMEAVDGDISAAGTDAQTQVLMEALLSTASGQGNESTEQPDFQIEYDAGQGIYRYILDGVVWFSASVPKDSITTEPVRIQTGDSQYISSVRRNDGKLKTGDTSDRHSLLVAEPGSYDICIYSQAGMDDLLTRDQVSKEEMQQMLSSGRKVNLHYRIIDAETGRLETVNTPGGFELTSARCDRKILPVTDRTQFLKADGTYEFQFTAKSNPEATYVLRFSLDRTAPYLSFEGKLDGLEGRAPVRVKASQEDAIITVRSSGGTYSFSGPEGILSAADSYWLTVQDPLGNTRSYRLFLAQSNQRILKLLGLSVVGIVIGILALYVKIRGEKMGEIR